MLNTTIHREASLIQKYESYSVPRYTSYPTAVEFSEAFGAENLYQAACRYPQHPLSLYVHLPFCRQLCYFCACNKLITRQADKVTRYLEHLAQEIQHYSPLFSTRLVNQLHWGGGTPTLLNNLQISQLNQQLRQTFHFTEETECSIEIDPRQVELSLLDHLRQEGFNRISIGVQDLNATVQQVINRQQDENLIAALIQRARGLKFHSIHLDLIYGLPQQTPETFTATLTKIIDWDPDRLSLFNYAHLPDRFPGQHKIKTIDLPNSQLKWIIWQRSQEQLLAAGYQWIGMDHFAKSTDDLFKAQQTGQLHRNFQGYTTHKNCELLGLGVSAISSLGDTYAQNQKLLGNYESQVAKSGQAIWRGLILSRDDCLRRDIIQSLICHFTLDIQQIEQHYSIQFADYFAAELSLLEALAADELLNIYPQRITVTPTGRLLIRQICCCFDRYFNPSSRKMFSRLI